MSIRKRGGKWVCDFKRGIVRIVKGGFLTRADAVNKYEELATQYRSNGGLLPSEKNKKILFKDYLLTFVNNRYSKESGSELKQSAFETAMSKVSILMPFFGHFLVSKITKSDIETFIRHRREQDGVSDSTINRDLALLKVSLNSAVDDGLMFINPMKKVKKLKDNNKRDRIMSIDEEKQFMNTVSEHLRNIVNFILNTGLRINEVLGLKWPDVNFNNQTATIRKTKNGKDFTFPLNKTALNLLNSLRQDKVLNFYVFTFKGQKLKSIRTAFENTCERAKITGLHIHDLRRTFATRLLNSGVDIHTISKLLNHSDIQMTVRYLSYDVNQNGANAVKILDTLYSATSS